MERIQTKFALSSVDADGEFRGYGAVFGNTDFYGDVIRKGAFKNTLEIWSDRKRLPHMLLQHGGIFGGVEDSLPIGVWTNMYEDHVGLWVEGKLLCLDTDLGKRVLGLMRAGVLDGLSIGFRPKKWSPGSNGVTRYLDEIALSEVSVVVDPANRLARVHAVKEQSPKMSSLSAEYDAAHEKLRAALLAWARESD